ncbi:MAG: YceI family protein [Balneolales bacterium]|nr:YceI family protein [Balneolales bacterium]
MKSFILSFLLLTSLTSFTAYAYAGNGELTKEHNHTMVWDIDRAHSNILFRINHFFNPVPGTFNDFEGKVSFNPDSPETSEIDVRVKVASVNTNVERRDGHLRTADFFDAERFPEMHFRSTDVRHVEGTSYVALGQLTIKDVTREIELPFEFLGVRDHLMRENTLVAGLHGSLMLKRNDFGVGTGDWASTAVIGDDVTIDISLQVTKEK